MGNVIGKAANGVGTVLGDAFVAPVRTIFGASCEGICWGTWDILCFLEHLCISSIVRLLMVLGLTCITVLFFYLLLKVGIIQCIGRSLCKMAWAACKAYWSTLEGISCFLWHKLKNTKRVHRHRPYDIEKGYTSSEDDRFSFHHGSSRIKRGCKSVRERKKDRMRVSLYPKSRRWKNRTYRSRSNRHSRHHVRLKTREVSLHLGASRRAYKPMKRSRKLFKVQRRR